MTMKTVKLENGEMLTLETSSKLGKGGEGVVYHVKSPATYAKTHCVKIYSDANKAVSMEKKIRYMSQHVPMAAHFVKLCWPQAAVLHRGKFVGYLMPLAFDESRNLLEIKSLDFKRRKKLPQVFKDIYDRETIAGLEARLKLCVNIAAAYHAIHMTRKFVIVDMKPDNVLMTKEGRISIVDCDSFQVSEKGKILFDATVFTPEYAPPHTKDTSKDIYWDYFSYAVLIYELIFGLHPYTATSKDSYEHTTDIASKIDNGLFVFGSKHKFIEKMPQTNPHHKFKKLPVVMQRLFIQVFDQDMSKAKHRGSLEDFGKTIYGILNAIDKKKVLIEMLNNQNSTVITTYKSKGEMYWNKLLNNTLSWKELALYFYSMTVVLTSMMFFIDILFESNGFLSFLGHVIKGIFTGVFGGIFWPLLLVGDTPHIWAIFFSMATTILILYKLKFYVEQYKKYFYTTVGIYSFITLVSLVNYFNA